MELRNPDNMSARIKAYWSRRSDTFKKTRELELEDQAIGLRWLDAFHKYAPSSQKSLDVLDIGTGAGYFAILLSKAGHRTFGVDLTPDMILAARDLARFHQVSPAFQVMDAMDLDFPDQSFDAVITRNLTWTLPDIPKAYREWFRVLRPGGVLLNFDANYGDNVRYEQSHPLASSQDSPYGHPLLSENMRRENTEITLAMEASRHPRPVWDLTLLPQCGFTAFGADLTAGKRILQTWDSIHSPLFLVWACREQA